MAAITVEATVELQKMITLLAAIKEGMSEGIMQAGKHIVDLASQLAPEDSGDLKRSGQVIPTEDGVDISFGEGLGDDRAIAQEYGTMYMPAQPYLGPAIANIDVTLEVAKAVTARLQ